jgi:hypothetical protein
MTLTNHVSSAHDEKFVVRFPHGMRERLSASARDNQRSMNAEVVFRMDHSLALEAEIARLKAVIDRLLTAPSPACPEGA